jgi:sugar lactone lactonase YvrE
MTALGPGWAPSPLADGFVFAEGPRWHGGKLWLSDMHGEAVYSVTLDGEKVTELELPGKKPSGLGFLPSGDLLIVSMRDRQLLRRDGAGSVSVHADFANLISDEVNDMVVAADGTAFVGSYPSVPGEGVLIRVSPNGSATVAADHLDFPNGTVVTPDGRTLIVAESMGRRLTAFDIDDNNNLGNRRTYAPTVNFAPDGIALDADGAVWASFPLGHEFQRILPGGEITDRIPVGDRMAIACALGGDDRRTLFLLSATDWNGEALAGRRTSTVVMVPVSVAGAGTP